MKSILTFLSIAFLCLSCQKRAPMNLSLPPLEVLQKMESQEQRAGLSHSDSSLKGIESGFLKMQGNEGEFAYNLKELCPVKNLNDETIVFSCLRFSSQEAFSRFSQVSLKEISLKPILNKMNLWEYEIETYFYWPENKLLVPLAALNKREEKEASVTLYKGEKGRGEAYLILRLKKMVERKNKDQLHIWANEKNLDLTEFDYLWQKNEDLKQEGVIDFKELYEFENLKLGTVLELDLLASRITPSFSETKRSMQVRVEGEALPAQKSISQISCQVFEQYPNGSSEKLIDLSQDSSNLKLRLNAGGKSYSLQELLAWGKASVLYGQGRLKLQLRITDLEWTKNLTLSVLPYEKFTRQIGEVRFGECNLRNVASYVIKQNLNYVLTEFSEEERYQGSYRLKETL